MPFDHDGSEQASSTARRIDASLNGVIFIAFDAIDCKVKQADHEGRLASTTPDEVCVIARAIVEWLWGLYGTLLNRTMFS